MTVKPCFGQLLVAQVAEETTTESGLILTGGSVETGLKPAIVQAVGPDAEELFGEGDKIYLPWGDSKPVTVNGMQMAFIDSTLVLGKVE